MRPIVLLRTTRHGYTHFVRPFYLLTNTKYVRPGKRIMATRVCLAVNLFCLCFAGMVHTASTLTSSDFNHFSEKQVEVGRLLFYDKILSGNRNISCSTCHHPQFGTSDGLALGVGEGGVGLGPKRTTGTKADRIERRVPRNAPALWNLGAKDIEVLMHDGRINTSDIYENGFNTPAQERLPEGLNSVVAVQSLFPMTSEVEMAGSNDENEIAGAANVRIDNAWPIIAKRVRAIPSYVELLAAAFDDVDQASHITIVHIANALAAFISTEFKSIDSPYDLWLDGQTDALSKQQILGKSLFFGKATCHSCHSGALFSNHSFKALSLPSFGPGRTRSWDPIPRDVGRMGETDRIEDAYRFRVPMLRNVALTAPYGHNGAYKTLREMIKHHRRPSVARTDWNQTDVQLPKAAWLDDIDFVIMQDKLEMQRQSSKIDIALPSINDQEIDALVAFLESLTGEQASSRRFHIPKVVPSGLPVDNCISCL